MRILVTTADFRQWIFKDFDYLLKEVAKLIDLVVWHDGGEISDILEQLNPQPDFIFVNEFTLSPVITGFSSINIPSAYYMCDLHYDLVWNHNFNRQIIKREKFDFVFSYYRDKFYEWYPDFSDRLRWLPHHVNTDIFKDYGNEKEIDYLLMGAVEPEWYSLRYKILNTMKKRPNFVYHQHPGYRNYGEQENVFIGEKYAQEISRAKMFFTCDSIYKYPLNKYFEVLASKTLLLAPSSKELSDLGFIPGVHFVEINADDFEEKAEYYLAHEEEREKIAQQGYEMVHSKHSTVHRAAQFVNMIAEILASHHK